MSAFRHSLEILPNRTVIRNDELMSVLNLRLMLNSFFPDEPLNWKMTQNNGTLDDYACSQGLILPLINEFTWSVEMRAFLYLLGLLYCFMGVAIIADIFMGAIEKITSTTRKVSRSTSCLIWIISSENLYRCVQVYLSRGGSQEPEMVEVRIWNGTVANLTLMALGSSAPEILLSIIGKFEWLYVRWLVF